MKGYLWSFLILPLIISCGAKVDDLDFDLNPTSEKEVEEIPKITTVGSLDVTFGGGDGYVVTSGSGAGDDDMKASAIDSNGKLVVVGEVEMVYSPMMEPQVHLENSIQAVGLPLTPIRKLLLQDTPTQIPLLGLSLRPQHGGLIRMEL